MSAPFLKKLAGLTGLLLVLWIVYLYRQVPHTRMPFAQAQSAVQKISLMQGVVAAELVKKGDRWNVTLPGGHAEPADEVKVKNLLSSLKDLQVEDEISDRADRHAEYQIDRASGTDIRFFDAGGKVLAEGIFGKQAPDFLHCYFRYPGEPVVSLARGVLPGDLGKPDPNYWRTRQLVSLGEANIQNVVVEGENFKTSLLRAGTDFWIMNGKTLQPGAADAFVGALAHLQVEDFMDASSARGLTYDGLSFARVTIRGPASNMDIRIGRMNKTSKRYPASAGPDAGFAWLSEASVKAILQKPSAFKTK